MNFMPIGSLIFLFIIRGEKKKQSEKQQQTTKSVHSKASRRYGNTNNKLRNNKVQNSGVQL